MAGAGLGSFVGKLAQGFATTKMSLDQVQREQDEKALQREIDFNQRQMSLTTDPEDLQMLVDRHHELLTNGLGKSGSKGKKADPSPLGDIIRNVSGHFAQAQPGIPDTSLAGVVNTSGAVPGTPAAAPPPAPPTSTPQRFILPEGGDQTGKLHIQRGREQQMAAALKQQQGISDIQTAARIKEDAAKAAEDRITFRLKQSQPPQLKVDNSLVGPDGVSPVLTDESGNFYGVDKQKLTVGQVKRYVPPVDPQLQEQRRLSIIRARQVINEGNQFSAGAGGGQAARGVTGESVLTTLSPGVAAQVKALAEGRQSFPTGTALRTPYWQKMLDLVGSYDPSFDATNYNARSKARADFTSPNGQAGKAIGALNTMLQHAGKLSDMVETLQNSRFPLVNMGRNAVKSALGQTPVTNFKVVSPQLLKEIEKLWRGTSGTAADLAELKASMNENMGLQQQREALYNFIELAMGKLDALTSQRDAVLGQFGAKIPVLYPQNVKILEKVNQRAGKAADENLSGESVTESTELPPASHFSGMAPGVYDVPKPGGGTVRVKWDGKTVSGG